MKTILLSLVSLFVATEAHAGRADIVDALRAFEGDVTVASLNAMSSNPVAELTALLDDSSVSTTVRKRAASALGLFDSTYETLQAALSSSRAEVRRSAAKALVNGFSTRDNVDNRFELLIALRPLLDDSEVDVRAAAVHALGELRMPEARTVLSQHFGVEMEDFVRNSIAVKLK